MNPPTDHIIAIPQINNSYWNEQWRVINFPEGALKKKYAISNYGRVISFTENIEKGRFVKGGCLKGYKTLPLRPFGRSTTYYVHKLVAEYFLPKPSADQKCVLHLDYHKGNNYSGNLKWANQEETIQHQGKNPSVLDGKKNNKNRQITQGTKLSATNVMRLKMKLLDPERKTKLRILARQFGISEMQLHRIRKGENWGHIQVTTNSKTEKL